VIRSIERAYPHRPGPDVDFRGNKIRSLSWILIQFLLRRYVLYVLLATLVMNGPFLQQSPGRLIGEGRSASPWHVWRQAGAFGLQQADPSRERD
jgi:hypothetical protein